MNVCAIDMCLFLYTFFSDAGKTLKILLWSCSFDFIPRAFIQENKFGHFQTVEYGMHKFPCYKMLFLVYLCNSKQMHPQSLHIETQITEGRDFRSGLEKTLVFLPSKCFQCVKLVLGIWIQWLGSERFL